MSRQNMGRTDRVLRFVVGTVLAVIGLFTLNGLEGALAGLAASVLALILLATSLTGFCPLYVPWGISTLAGKGPTAPKT